MRRALSILLSVAALSLAACGLLPPTFTPPPPTATQTATPTSTATIVWFPPTSTPTLFVPTSPPPTPDMRPALAELLLQDDFSDPGSWKTQSADSGSAAFGKNEFTIALPNLDYRYTLISLRNATTVDDFYLEMTITPNLCSGENSYGILFRAQSETQHYRLVISCAGLLRLERINGSEIRTLQDWTSTGFASPNAPVTLRVGIWASRREMRVFINDIFQFNAFDSTFYSGQIGVFARTLGGPALTVNFSDLKIYAVRGFEPTPLPTATIKPTATRAPRTTP